MAGSGWKYAKEREVITMGNIRSVDLIETIFGYAVVADDGVKRWYVSAYYNGQYTWYSDKAWAKGFSLRSALMHYKRICAQYSLAA